MKRIETARWGTV